MGVASKPLRPVVCLRIFALLSVVAVALFLYRAAHKKQEVNYLPQIGTADWIRYPNAPDVLQHLCLNVSTEFRRSFTLDQTPAHAPLRVAGFRHYQLSINGKLPEPPPHPAGNWKQPDEYDIAALLQLGTNAITVVVFNDTGPPAMWFELRLDGWFILGDSSWQSSYLGAEWCPAVSVHSPPWIVTGTPSFGGERPRDALRSHWATLLGFAVLSAISYVIWMRIRSRQPPPEPVSFSKGNLRAWVAGNDLTPLLALALGWIVLFAHNLPSLPPLVGYDVKGHIGYVNYIQERLALPAAGEGWELYQPPLYYSLGAAALTVLGLTTNDPGGILTLRLLGLAIGLVHLVLLWASLRMIFPGSRAGANAGLLLAGCLPPWLYLSQYITNEGLAAALATASLWLTLRILTQGGLNWRNCTALGLCLGCAMLAKSSTTLLLPAVFGALAWQWFTTRPTTFLRWSARVGAAFGTCAIVCGWFYAWRAVECGSLGAGWNPRAVFPIWMDGGYATAAYYVRFGAVFQLPWFSGLNSFLDGLYSTLWGDGQFGGVGAFGARPPWNYNLMALGYWLAILPSLVLLLGTVVAVLRFLRKPSAIWFLVLAVVFLAIFSLIFMSLTVASFAIVKSSYVLSALLPVCALFGAGFEWASRHRMVKAVLAAALGIWAINAWASLWIPESAANTTISQAWSLVRQGRFPDAIGKLQTHLNARPGDTEIASVLAYMLLESRDREGAAKTAEQLLQARPDDYAAHVVLARCYNLAGQFDAAAGHAQRAVELAPGYNPAHEQLALARFYQGQTAAAESAARRGLRAYAFDAGLHLVLACALVGTDQMSETDAHSQLAFILRPEWPEGHELLGMALARGGKFPEALAQLTQALSAAPESFTANRSLGSLLLQMDRPAEAEHFLSSAERAAPGDAETKYLLADSLWRQNKASAAAEKAQAARALALGSGQADIAAKCAALLRKAASGNSKPE